MNKLNKNKYSIIIIIIILYQLVLNVFHNEKCKVISQKLFSDGRLLTDSPKTSSNISISEYIEIIKCLINQPLTNYNLYSFTFDMKFLILLSITIIYINILGGIKENPETTEITTKETKIDKSINIETTANLLRLLIEMSIVFTLVIKYSIILIILYIGLFLLAAPIITWLWDYVSGL